MYRIIIALLTVILFSSCGTMGPIHNDTPRTMQSANNLTPIKEEPAQELAVGMSLNELSKQVSSNTKWRMVDLGIWIENTMYLYEVTPKYTLLYSNALFEFGVLVNDANPYYLIDIDGDSVLDVKTNVLHAPYWVATTNSVKDGRNENVMFLFDYWYYAFQDNDSPRNSNLVINLAMEYAKAAKSEAYINRDLIYLHQLYDQLYAAGEYDLALRYLAMLDDETQSRYGMGTHIIILIYTLESLYKLQNYDRALRQNNILLQHFPDCIVGQVYQVLLETDPVERNRLKVALLAKHGDHWLVRDKLSAM
jgi:hypothetical protein